jgi:hypothetical protein
MPEFFNPKRLEVSIFNSQEARVIDHLFVEQESFKNPAHFDLSKWDIFIKLTRKDGFVPGFFMHEDGLTVKWAYSDPNAHLVEDEWHRVKFEREDGNTHE